MTEQVQIRQGDVLLVPVERVPDNLNKRKDQTLALGETTGHSHAVKEAEVFGAMDGLQFVVAEKDTEIEHLPDRIDHDNVQVGTGIYEVAVQVQETAEEAARRVLD